MPYVIRPYMRLFILAIYALALLSGCATVVSTPGPEQQLAIERAESLEHQGDFLGAAQSWLVLAEDSRGLRDSFLLNAAGAYRQLGAWDRAQPVLQRIERRALDPYQAQRFDLLRAETALAFGRSAEALALTARADTVPSPLRARNLELRARAQVAAGVPFAAARTRLTLDAMLEGYGRSQNQQQLQALLRSLNSTRLSEHARTLAANDPLRSWITETLAASGLALPTQLPELHRPVGTVLPNNGSGSFREGYKLPQQVALLLPLHGTLQRAATAVRDGFFTAFAADATQAAGTRIDVYDTGSSVFGAVDAYKRAAADDADIVVGPLGPDAVTALFQLQELPVPLLALNHANAGLPPPGSAEFSLPPEAEAAQAAARMSARGLTRALVFASEAPWAQRAARAFHAQFESLGGQVLGTATLADAQVNYASAIAAISTGIDQGTGVEYETGVDPSINADQNAGVFVALRPRQGRLLIPQLEIAGIYLPVFATSHIYAAENNKGLDRDLNGVQFSDAPWLFDAQPGLPMRSDLKDTMITANGPAARLFAFGMDAWNLLPYLDWLREHPGSYLSGATGQLTMDRFGRIHRTPLWVHFVNGIAVPMSGGLNADNRTP